MSGEEILNGAHAAIREGWPFERYLRACKDAWVIAHQEALEDAKECVLASYAQAAQPREKP